MKIFFAKDKWSFIKIIFKINDYFLRQIHKKHLSRKYKKM